MSADDDDGRVRVRPYAMTGGRTQARVDLAIETLVVTTPRGRATLGRLAFEQAKIVRLADAPLSIAEVAARVGVVLGVARILVADLVAAGMLESRSGLTDQRKDAALLERVLDGLKAL